MVLGGVGISGVVEGRKSSINSGGANVIDVDFNVVLLFFFLCFLVFFLVCLGCNVCHL